MPSTTGMPRSPSQASRLLVARHDEWWADISRTTTAMTCGLSDSRSSAFDAVVADLRGRHHHDLPEVGRIGEDLLVPGEVGREDHLAGCGGKRTARSSREPRAVFEQHVSRVQRLPLIVPVPSSDRPAVSPGPWQGPLPAPAVGAA